MFTPILRAVRPLRSLRPVSRALHTTPIARGVQEITRPAIETPLSLWNFTEEEEMLRDTGQSSSNAHMLNL